MNNKDRQALVRICEETVIIRDLVAGMDFTAFCADEKTKRAVCMTLINIGELVKSLSDDLRASNAHIPWRAIAGLRDVTAHHYQTIMIEDIWQTIIADIPLLHTQIINLFKEYD